MKSTSFKKLTEKQLSNCISFDGFDNSSELHSGDTGLTVNKGGVIITTSCYNCGDYSKVYLSKQKLKILLKQM